MSDLGRGARTAHQDRPDIKYNFNLEILEHQHRSPLADKRIF